MLGALLAMHLGWDHTLAAWFYDPELGAFPARGVVALEQLGHRAARVVLELIWLGLVLLAGTAGMVPNLRAHRRTLVLTAIAMALGPLLVSMLKNMTTPVCPWDQPYFGGQAVVPSSFWAINAPAGHCFPGGHAAAGFALIAFYWAGRATGQRRLQAVGLILACVVGTALSAVRMVQGAHFLSHNLWSAAIVWLAAQAVFTTAPYLVPSQKSVDHDA
jgi:membrane-associated PAP2 superfamily phosphatase